MNLLHYKIIGAPKKFKHQPRPLVRPSFLKFVQIFEIYLMRQSLERKQNPYESCTHQKYNTTSRLLNFRLCNSKKDPPLKNSIGLKGTVAPV